MGNLQAHDLHKMVRSWLLSEDPYGLSGNSMGERFEPPMGRSSTPDLDPLGHLGSDRSNLQRADPRQQGEQTLERALAPGARTEPTVSGETAHAAGLKGVDAEVDKYNTELWRANMEARKADRARAGEQGYAAVKDATRPAAIRDMIKSMSQPPAYTPQESAALADWQGYNAVAGVAPPQGPAGWYPPQSTAPTATTETTNPNQGYAPSAKRASHWGLKAVESELDKEPE